ncbi:FxDxF family PEP-CTERM protein [Rhizobacter sp. LjRoot28]|uniref:FxDxF family PEP-CTERM protein n=1 Tax=Rhizobacter sp. LjRoot28 TaxID=3342309 RepID=UPI003ECEEB13
MLGRSGRSPTAFSKEKPMCRNALMTAALLAAAQVVSAATCATSPLSLGTLGHSPWPGTGADFGAWCTASAPADPPTGDEWTFSQTFHFTLAGPATLLIADLDLNFTRDSVANGGQALYMIGIGSIWLIRDGVVVDTGGELPGLYERAFLTAQDLDAGAYSLVVLGRVFNTPTRSGWYDGTLNVSYVDPSVAAPVPEPATWAALLTAVPIVGAMTGQGRRRRVAPKP